MPKPLSPFTVSNVGQYGLNKQEGDSQLPIGWATEATNLVFNEKGTLEARKGLDAKHSSTYGTIRGIHTYIERDGDKLTIFSSGTKIYKLVGTTVTDITGMLTTPTDGNWQFATYNGHCLAYQDGHETGYLSTTDSVFVAASGTQYDSDMVCSAYGRSWTVYENVLLYTELLGEDYAQFGSGLTIDISTVDPSFGIIFVVAINAAGSLYQVGDLVEIDQGSETIKAILEVTSVNSSGGVTAVSISINGRGYSTGTGESTSFQQQGTGAFDLSLYWPKGHDTAVAIKEWNNLLLVFGKKSILVYGNPHDPDDSMTLIETVTDSGCIARDSIQEIGNDILFLSYGGIKSLGKIFNEGDSIPFNDVSVNVKDYVLTLVAAESSPEYIKSAYSQKEGFYLISFPTSDVTLVFDVSKRLPDGSFRCTEWDTGFTAMHSDDSDNLILANGGVLYDYTGYDDEGSTYDITYNGAWNDFGAEASSYRKIPKRLEATISGADDDTITTYWYYDFDDSVEYSGTASLLNSKFRVPLSGSGDVMKVGFSATIDGSNMILKRYSIHTKFGSL